MTPHQRALLRDNPFLGHAHDARLTPDLRRFAQWATTLDGHMEILALKWALPIGLTPGETASLIYTYYVCEVKGQC